MGYNFYNIMWVKKADIKLLLGCATCNEWCVGLIPTAETDRIRGCIKERCKK